MATYNINLNLSTAAAQAQLSALQTAAGKPITAKVNFSQPLGRITGDLAMFDKSMAAASARVAAFGVTSGAIYLVSKAMSEAAKSMMLVDKELTELNTFLGQSQGQLKAFGDSLFSIAKNTATSFSAVAEAAKEFARQGLSMEDTLKRTNDALILSRISGLGAAESVTALTTAINSFNKSGLTSAEIVNKLVQVDSQFAVSSSDLAQALSRVGSSAQDSGVSIDQLIASVTAAQQTTGRGGAVIGNALKTIFTRMKRPEVIDQLREIGVAVKDQNGYFLDGVTILKNYTDATKNLSQTEKAKTAELLGGIYQINVLNSLINDLSKSNGVYARSLQASNTATDQAFDKNEALNQSLSATIEITKANLQQKGAAIATPLLTPLVKTGAAIVNKTLNIFDKKEGDEEGAKSGRSFGESLLKGLGAAIAGPGIVIVGALALAIGKKLLTFGTEAVRSLLGVTSSSQNILNLQSLITSTLNNQPQIIQQIVSGQISQTTAAQALLTIMQQQAAQLQTNATLSSTLANTLAQGGFTVSPTTGLKKRRAMGYIPKADQDAERAGALSGGYSPGAVVKTPSSIGGIMNTSEEVKYVPGFSQPFINPPENSKAGRMHQENAIKQTGVNPYSSRGFIPNFDLISHKASYYKGNQLIEARADQISNNDKKYNDSFLADIQPIAMQKTIEQYTRQASGIVGGIWGKGAVRGEHRNTPLNATQLKNFQKTFQGKVGGTSYARALSSLQNMKGPEGGYMNARNQVQGLIGEAEVIKTTGGTATRGNAFFDVVLKNQPKKTSKLAEVRTRQVVNKEDILLKAILQRLQGISYRGNKKEDAIDLGTYKTYLPSNAKFKSLGFIPNFAYLDEVKQLESEAGNGTAIFDTEPFPHVRNSSQPTFESAINDHGGLQNALSDSASMQKGAGLIKSKGFVPNFSKISDWWEQKRKDERLADMAAFRAKHGNMNNYQPQEGPSVMSGMIKSSLIGGASMMLSGAANQNNVGTIANVQRGVPLAMAGIDIASGFARGRTGWGKAANVGMAIAQNAPAIISGFSGASQTEADVRSDQFQKVKDNTADKFNKLTQNAGQLAQSIEDLNNAYLDPSVSPETLIKLGKKQAELMRSMDKSNPQAAMKLATARTSAEKQTILTDAVESATKDKVVNDASIKFLELDDKKRKPKAIKSLFSDWSSQADMSKLDVKNLTPQNLGEALKKAGIGDVNKVLAGTKGKLITPFINFLQTNDKISDKEEVTKNQLTNLRRPSSDIRMQNEQNKKLRAIKKSSRGDYLNDLVDYASNFGPESEIDARRNVDVAMESAQERAKFGAMISSKAEKMPGLSRFIGQGPSQELESSLKNSIKQTKDPKQKNELEAVLSETKQSQNTLQGIESKADEKKKKDLALLALKQRLVFGGGMAASLSYEGKRASDEPTARASMQNALGNRFGSRNTADAGYVNFAKGVKEKYAGLNFGEGAFDRATEVGANLRARDLRKSLLRDARRADRMGDYQLGGAMRAKANDSQDLYAIGKTQTQAHLGLGKMPEEVRQAISDYSRENTQDDMEKRSDDQRLSASEKAMQPKADALINESSKDTKTKMDEFEAALGASFERGLIIKQAQIIVQGLDPDSEKKKEGSFMDGVMSYFSDMASDVSDYVTGNEGPDASSADQAAAAGMGKASGFIPNFKSPLRDAIHRESEFVPFNSIRVDQSNKLKQSSNPFGLAVTNTIDEPRGLASIGLADGYIPNFAAFGQKKAGLARKQASLGKLYVWDHVSNGFRKVTPSGLVDTALINSNDLPKGSRTISTELGHTGGKGKSILGLKDPKITKLDELKLPGVARSQPIDRILSRLNEQGNLTPENLLTEINKKTKGEDVVIKTAFGKSDKQGLGVFGRTGKLTTSDAGTIIDRYSKGAASGFFTQAKVPTYYNELRVHVSVDDKGNVKIIKGATILKATKVGPTTEASIQSYMKAGLPRDEAVKMTQSFKKSAESSAVHAIRAAVKQKGIKNAFFGVDVGGTTLEAAKNAGVKSREFYSGGRGKVGTIVFEVNPSDLSGSSGYMGGNLSEKLVKNVFGQNPTSPLSAPSRSSSPSGNTPLTTPPSSPSGTTPPTAPLTPPPKKSSNTGSKQSKVVKPGGRDIFNPKTGRYDYFGAKKPGNKTSSVESQNKGGQAGSRPGYKMGGVAKFFGISEVALRAKGVYDISQDANLSEAEKGEKITGEAIALVRDQAINFAASYGQYRFANRAGGPANAGAPGGKTTGGKGSGGKGSGGKGPFRDARGRFAKDPGGKIPKGGPRGGAGSMSGLAKIGAAAGALHTLSSLYDIHKDYKKGLISKEDAQSEALKAAAWGALYVALPFIPVVGPIIGGILLAKGVWDTGYAVGGMIEEGIGLGDKLGAMTMSMQGEDENGNWKTRLNERLLADARSKPEYQEGRSARLIANKQSAAALQAERADRLAGIQVAEKENEILASQVPGAFRQERDWENRGEIKSVPDVNNFTYKQEKKLLDERKQRFLSVKRDVLDSPVDIPRMTDMGAPHDSYRVGANKLRHDPRLAAMYTSQSSPKSDNERLNQYLSMSESDAAYFDAKIASLEQYKTEFNRIEGNVAAYRMANAVKDRKGVNASDKEATILNMYRQLPVEDTVLKKKGMDISVRQGISPMDNNDEALLARITDFHGDRHSFSSPGGDNSLSARLNRAKAQEMEEQANKNMYSALGMGAFGAQIDRLTPHPREEKEAKEKAERDAKLLQAMGLFYNKPLPGDPDSKTATSEEMINHAKKRGLWDNEPIVYDWQQRTMKPSGDSELALLSPEQREKAFRLMADAVKARTGFAAPLDEYQRPNAEQNALEIKDKKDLMLREYMRDPSLASVDPTLIPAIRGQQSKVLDDRQQRMTAFLEKDGSLTRATFPGKSDSQIMLNYLDMSDSQREKADALLIKQESLARLDKEAAGGALLNATTPENPALTRTFAALGESNQVTLRSVAGNPLSAMTPQGLGLTSEGLEAAGMLNKEQESINKNQTESMTELEKLLNGNSNGFIPARSGKINNYAAGFAPVFMQEKRAVLSSPSYAGHRDAVPMRSSVYKNAVINSAEIEVPASEVYSRMFGPAGANMKPKNPSETHAILNPAQQQSLGFSAGFIPNFSTEQFTAAITEAMKNGIASFAGGMIPNVSHSNTVNINDERSYQGNSDSMMDGVLDILQSKFPKEMGKMGPRIAKR